MSVRERLRAVREPRGFAHALRWLPTIPAALGLVALTSDFLLGTRWLGANPIKELEHRIGQWILWWLGATLAVTPVRRWLGWNWLARHRRTLGLHTFGYAVLHVLVYALLDVQLDRQELAKDLTKRPYIIIGMTGLLVLVPLAVTSTTGWMRRLGRRWAMLHRLVYLVPVLGVTHFWMAVKSDIRAPAAAALAFALLLAARIRGRGTGA